MGSRTSYDILNPMNLDIYIIRSSSKWLFFSCFNRNLLEITTGGRIGLSPKTVISANDIPVPVSNEFFLYSLFEDV